MLQGCQWRFNIHGLKMSKNSSDKLRKNGYHKTDLCAALQPCWQLQSDFSLQNIKYPAMRPLCEWSRAGTEGPETPVSSSSVPMVTIGPVPHTINSHITLLIDLQPTHRAAHRGYLAKTSPVEPLKRSFHCKNQINGGLKMAHEWEIRPRRNSRSKKDITFQSSIVSLAGITDSFQFTI